MIADTETSEESPTSQEAESSSAAPQESPAPEAKESVVSEPEKTTEPPVEVKPEEKSAPEPQGEVTPVAPKEKDISEGLEENLNKAGLTQVATKADLVKAPTYEPVKHLGRPRPVLPPVSVEPPIPVQTKTDD